MSGSDFDIPIMYQDLANSSMQAFSNPIGAYGYNNPYCTSYLGGITMPRQLTNDKLEIINKKDKDFKHNLKKSFVILGSIAAAGGILALGRSIKKGGKIGKSISNAFHNLAKKFKRP